MPAPPERSVLVSAARSAAINRDFAQNGFALRSVIATSSDILKFLTQLFIIQVWTYSIERRAAVCALVPRPPAL